MALHDDGGVDEDERSDAGLSPYHAGEPGMPMGKVLNFGERVLVTGHTESCFYGAVYEH